MVNRRILAFVAALLLAGVGALLLSSYVKGADQRAMAGLETAEVLVVTSLIAQGTAADSLTKQVSVEILPVKAVAAGSVSDLGELTGRVATTDLQPGEQLLASRWADPATLERSNEVKIPVGMQQITVPLERPRMLGALLTPGATVGIYLTLPTEGAVPAHTHAMLHKVLVTGVGEPVTTAPEGDAKKSEAAPAGSVLITFAVSAADAEKIIFGAENGRLWLSLEPSDADTSGTRVVNGKNVNP